MRARRQGGRQGRTRVAPIPRMHGVLLDTSAAPPNTQWAAVVLAVLTVVYIAFVRPLKKGKKSDPLAKRPGDAALAQQRAVERDMTALLLEYEQVIRTMSSQLETRVAKLDVLLREADEKLVALRAAGAADATRGVALPVRRPASAPPAASDDSGAEFEVPPEPVPVPDEPPRHAAVYALADEGMGYRQIAQKLDRAYGEIELILALRLKAAATTTTTTTTTTADAADGEHALSPRVPSGRPKEFAGVRAGGEATPAGTSHKSRRRTR